MMRKHLLFILIAVGLTSCSESIYYQMYRVKPETVAGATFDGSKMVYSDDVCEIRYDLWEDGGDIGFVFTNKTDSIICVDMTRSYFIFNGRAYDYYRNRTYSNTVSNGVGYSSGRSVVGSITGLTYDGYLGTISAARSTAAATTVGNSKTRTQRESEEVCIPPMSSKIISEYNIFESPLRYCGLAKFPRRKENDSVSFTEENSPIKFSNYITYRTDESSNVKTIENGFYIDEIKNMPESQFVTLSKKRSCDPNDKNRVPVYYWNYQLYGKSAFFNKYSTSSKFDDSLMEWYPVSGSFEGFIESPTKD